MTLAAGTRLGPYEIVAPVGAGGMGEVYRATDTRLDRSVAVKILPSDFASNAQLRLRFEREAKTISQLEHPHICRLYDVGDSYLVMELLDGETLAERLSRGPLPLPDVLTYGVQISEALDRAHRAGVVHRDLKPGNVMLTKSGAKLLDFGLAKSSTVIPSRAEGEESPTQARGGSLAPLGMTPLTREGTVLGTFQYMAPEQLSGEEADARSDIFALGTVLYEMVTGARAFSGKNKTSLIANILAAEPRAIGALQPMTPPALDHIIRKCLAKDPDERWQSAYDIASELRWIDEAGSQAGVAAPVVLRRKTREQFAWILGALCAVGLIGFAALWYRLWTKPVESVQSSILPPPKYEFDFDLGAPALSPDGRRIAFLARGGDGKKLIWVRPLNALGAQPLAGTDEARYPFWSPDNRYLGFFADGKLKKIDVAGGPPQTLCDASTGFGGTWSRQGTIVFTASGNSGLSKVPASGGTPIVVAEPQGNDFSYRLPSFLPDGEHVLFISRGAGNYANGFPVSVLSLKSGKKAKLLDASSSAIYTPGYLLFLRERTLVAQPFDASRLRLTGDAFPVAEDVSLGTNPASAIFSVSEQGHLAYQSGGSRSSQLMLVDRSGKVISNVGTPADYSSPAISHDARRAAVALRTPNAATGDIWIIDLTKGTTTRLTFDPTASFTPIWSPDDTRVLFTSARNDPGDLYQKPVSGVGKEEEVVRMPGFQVATDWSRDGRYIAFQSFTSNWDLWVYSVAEKKAFPFIQTPFNKFSARFSPDGKWVVYTSVESGKNQIYVQSFPSSGGKWQVSTDGGANPRWSPHGDEIFYLAGRTVMSVAVKTEATFESGMPRPMFEIRPKAGNDLRYSVAPDGQRFLIDNPLDEVKAPITLIQNWAAGRKENR